jgi:putative heme transporter
VTASGSADSQVPAWVRRTGAISWRLLAIAGLGGVLVWAAFLLGTVTASVLLALIVAAAFAPMMQRLGARGWSRTKAAAATTVAAVVVGIVLFLLLALALIPEIRDLVVAIRAGIDALHAQLEAASIDPLVADQLVGVAEEIRSWIGAHVGALASGVADVVTVGILALFLIFFLLQDGARVWAWLLQSTPAHKRERIEASGRDALARVGGYLRGTTVLSAVRAAAFGAFLWLLGVPHVPGLALLIFVGGFIPYLGGIVSMVIVLVVALATVGPQTTLILLILMAVTSAIVSNVLRPTVYGKSVHLHPAIILIALPAGAAVAGIIGLFAAIPVTALIVAFGGAAIAVLEPDEAPPEDRIVSGWVDRLARWSWRLLAAIVVSAIVLFLIGQAPIVVTPVVLAIIIAATVAPLARMLRRRGWSASRASLAVTGGAVVIILAVITIAVLQLAGPIAEAISSSTEGAAALEDDGGGTLGWVEGLAQTVGGDILSTIAAFLQAIGTASVVFVLAALLSFYFVRDGHAARSRILERAPHWRREPLERASVRSMEILGGYMFGTAAISAVGAISQLVIMLLLGLPFAVPIAVLSFILAFIPYIGGFITTGIAFLIAVQFGTPTQIVIMFVYTIVFNIIQGNVVTPIVYNRAVNLHPAVVLLAIPAGGAVAGIAGMFLAVPFLAVLSVTWRTALYVLGDRPSTLPERVIESQEEPPGGSEVREGAPA